MKNVIITGLICGAIGGAIVGVSDIALRKHFNPPATCYYAGQFSASMLETNWESMATNGNHILQVGIVTSNHCDWLPLSHMTNWPPVTITATKLKPLSRVLECTVVQSNVFENFVTPDGKWLNRIIVVTRESVVGTATESSHGEEFYDRTYLTNAAETNEFTFGLIEGIVSSNIYFINR